jgi:hypothetical protein
MTNCSQVLLSFQLAYLHGGDGRRGVRLPPADGYRGQGEAKGCHVVGVSRQISGGANWDGAQRSMVTILEY